MAQLNLNMPPINIPQQVLSIWGQSWLSRTDHLTGSRKDPNAFTRKQSVNFGFIFDEEVGSALAHLLGNIPVVSPLGRNKSEELLPPGPDCVEVGPARVVGGIRPQNFDVAYRPDGVRFAFDSKTLNDRKSVGKNWQNMINDLSTEATTVHSRFPYAIVSFIVVIPEPALDPTQEANIIQVLERLGTRHGVNDSHHLAEAIAFVVWDPQTGLIKPNKPDPTSNIRVETFADTISQHYIHRYKGLPPHD